MKTFKLTFAIKSPNEERETLLDIEGILQDAIKDCSLPYQVSPIRIKETLMEIYHDK